MKPLPHLNHSSANINSALLVARLGVGALMLSHGIPKISRFSDNPVMFVEFAGMGAEVTLALAIFAEVLCSVLIMIGFATRFATIPLIITMLVAVLHVHGADPFSSKEPGLQYLLVYILLLLTGAGKYSVDYVMSRNREMKQ